MGTFYGDLATTAAGLIKGKGQAMALVRDDGAEVIPVWGVDMPMPSREVDGMEVLRTDRKVLLAIGVEPKLTDRIIIGSVPCAILNVKITAPAGLAVMYTLQARAGG